MSEQKATKAHEMLFRIQRATDSAAGCILTQVFVLESASAQARMNALLDCGVIERCPHPTIVAGRNPAPAVRITDKGRAMINGIKP